MDNRAARVIASIALLLTGGCLTGCEGRNASRRPNVVIVVVDTLRADRVGAVRPQGRLTPFLDDLARRGTRYERAYAASSWTSPSVASLFTSRYPSQHRVSGFASILTDSEVTLAEHLHAAGYATAGFSANPVLPATGGWAQGFDVWQTFPAIKLRAPQLTKACLKWLDAEWLRQADRPLFLYVQYMEPRAPYEAPAAVRAMVAPGVSDDVVRRLNTVLVKLAWTDFTPADVRALAALYDAEVAAADAGLRELFDGLKARGVLEKALIVVTADHGEELNEHELFAHGWSLYEPAIRVPLVVVGEPFPAGHVARTLVSLLDVAPTVLELVGLPGEDRFEGGSLLPAVYGPAREGDVATEILSWQESDWRQHEARLIRGGLKLLVPPASLRPYSQDVVYDLRDDPLEAHPNALGTALDGVILGTELARFRERLRARRSPEEGRKALTPERREGCANLGYVR